MHEIKLFSVCTPLAYGANYSLALREVKLPVQGHTVDE
jgi:hypothetical protein